MAAALALLDQERGVTMRRLADALDTGPASLYVYYANVDELYADVLDELLGTLDFRRGRKAWRARLIALLISYTEVLHAHPALARTALVARPIGPNARTLWDALLGLLHEGEVTSADAAWGVDLLLQCATATAVEHSAHAQAMGARVDDARLAEAISHASAESHPHLAASTDELLSGRPLDRLAWAFDVLATGIAATPRPG